MSFQKLNNVEWLTDWLGARGATASKNKSSIDVCRSTDLWGVREGGLVVLPWRTELRLDLQTSHPENSVDHVVNLIPWKQNIQTSQILDYTRPLSLFNLHACSKNWGDRGIGFSGGGRKRVQNETTGEKYFFWYLLAVGGSMGCRWHSDEGWLDSSRPDFSLHRCQKSIKHLPALTWLLYFNKIYVLPSHYVAPQQIYHELKWYLFIDRHTINLQSLNSSGLKKLGPPGGLHQSTPC